MDSERTTAEIFRSLGLANEKIDDLLMHLEILSNTDAVGSSGIRTGSCDQRSNEIDAELAAVDVALESARLELEQELNELQPAEEVLSPKEVRSLLNANGSQLGTKGRELYAQSKAEAARELAEIEASLERIMNGDSRDQLEKQIRFRNHQLETMEREMLLKKSLLDKKVYERASHARSLKETVNETLFAQTTRILENMTVKQSEVDLLETGLLASHKQAAEARRAVLQRLLSDLRGSEEEVAAELHQAQVMEQQINDLQTSLEPVLLRIVELESQTQRLRESRHKLEHEIMQLVVFQETEIDLDEYHKLSQLEDARLLAEKELIALDKQIAAARSSLELTQQDFRQVIAMKQLGKHQHYESAVHAEDARLEKSLKISADADLEGLLETNKRYHRLAVLQLAADVSRRSQGDRASTRRALELLQAHHNSNQNQPKVPIAEPLPSPNTRHRSHRVSTPQRGKRLEALDMSTAQLQQRPSSTGRKQNTKVEYWGYIHHNLQQAARSLQRQASEHLHQLQPLELRQAEAPPPRPSSGDRDTPSPASPPPSSSSASPSTSPSTSPECLALLTRKRDELKQSVQHLQGEVDELAPLEAEAEMHVELDLRSQRLATQILQTKISYLEQQLRASTLGQQLLTGFQERKGDDARLDLEHALLTNIAQLVGHYNSMASAVDDSTVAMQEKRRLSTETKNCIINALPLLCDRTTSN